MVILTHGDEGGGHAVDLLCDLVTSPTPCRGASACKYMEAGAPQQDNGYDCGLFALGAKPPLPWKFL